MKEHHKSNKKEGNVIVLKFGGTSVNSRERLQTICEIVKREYNNQPVVVVSALRGVTDLLLSCVTAAASQRKILLKEIEQLHLTLIDEYENDIDTPDILVFLAQSLREIEDLLSKKEPKNALTDLIVSYGERLSSYIISHVLTSEGVKSQPVIATELIVTTNEFGSADFLPDETKKKVESVLFPLLHQGIVPVITGFIGATRSGEVTTLGRGGSDYSAAIIGHSLGASEIQIWTDVDGIYSADPRYVLSARRIPNVSFREASELAAFGAKVLHPRTIRPAVSQGIPVRVVSTLHPESVGTIISDDEHFSPRVIAVASKPRITLVNLYSTEMLLTKGFLKRIFAVFEKYAISVDLVSVSEVSVSVTLDNDDQLADAIYDLGKFTTVVTKAMGMVSLIGEGIVAVPHVMRDIFTVLDDAGIAVQVISLGASAINTSFVVDSQDVLRAVQLLHDKLITKELLVKGEDNYENSLNRLR